MHFFDRLIENNALPQNHWGYYILFAAAICEAIPIFGMLIPGQTLVIIAGFLARMHIFHPLPLLLIIASGAFLGDSFGYYIGKKYGYHFIIKYGKYFFLKKQHFEKVEDLMKEHTGKALILGRLNSLTRAIAPFVAGSSRVELTKFLTFNFFGALIWAFTFLFIGIAFGESYKMFSKYIGKFFFFAVILSVGIVYIYRFVDKRKHIFEKYHLYALSICIASLYIFTKILEDVSEGSAIIKVDTWINSNIVNLWDPTLNKIAIFITNIGGVFSITILSIALLVCLLIAKKWYNSFLLLFCMAGGTAVMEILKSIIQRPRPTNSFIIVTDYSFPSGHAMMSIIFFSLLLYSFKDDIKNRLLKILFIAANVVAFLLIGLSRIYLNVHWVSDVVAGFALGLFWLTLLILAFKITIFLYHMYRRRIYRPHHG